MKSILTYIKKIKLQSFGEVRIQGTLNGTSYDLLLLTGETVEDAHIVSLLSKWRKKHERWFQAQFPITDERTKKWLKERVISVPDRLLFLISVDGVYMGHVGLFRFDLKTKRCEIDNVIRGEEGYPGIMSDAIETMMIWGRQELQLRGYTLQTMANHEKAWRLYRRLGFIETQRVPYVYKKTSDGGEWIEAPAGYSKPITRYNVFMKQRFTPLTPSKKKISFAGPWITNKEIKYVINGVKHGFYETYDLHTKKLEKKVSEYLGVRYALATHCCTLALHLACVSLSFKKGDEVICTDLSWVATSYAIAYTGATPVFVDVDPGTWCIDPKAIERAITKKTKAIMLVHMFGHPARMDEIMAIAKKYKLKVIEDAAPAMGSTFKGRNVGTFGDFGCFSFQGAKIAVSGEGGILVTNDETLYKRASLLAAMGRTDSKAVFWSDMIGYQYTIGNLSASLALAQMERIEELIAKKRQIFSWYYERLKGVSGMKLLTEKKHCFSNYCYPSLSIDASVQTPRDMILIKLKALNIHARPSFPRMSRFPVFKARYANPVATEVEKYGVSLPAAGNLTESDIDFVCKALQRIVLS